MYSLLTFFAMIYKNHRCVKSVRIQSYSVRIWESTDQNNSEYEHFLRSASNNGPLNVENLKLPVFSSE